MDTPITILLAMIAAIIFLFVVSFQRIEEEAQLMQDKYEEDLHQTIYVLRFVTKNDAETLITKFGQRWENIIDKHELAQGIRRLHMERDTPLYEIGQFSNN